MKNSSRGRFIVFEGIDASGKSTQVARLAELLQRRGREVHVTAEPTSGPVGSLIRQAFSGRVPLDDRVIAALFVADRLDHLTNERDGLLAILDRGVDVISDRYYLSSVAYHASDIDPAWIVSANSVSTDLLRPDLTIYLDLSPSVAFDRLQRRVGLTDKFEVLDRLTSAHRSYATAIERFRDRDRICDLPAIGTVDHIHELVRKSFDASFNSRAETI